MRFASIDLVRVIAIFAVVVIHSPLRAEDFRLSVCSNLLTRFAVPYFFIISSYFYSKKLSRINGALSFSVYWSFATRVLLIFICWSALYILAPKFSLLNQYGVVNGILLSIQERTDAVLNDPIHFLYTGTAPHLWFLTSLLVGITVLTLSSAIKVHKFLPVFAVALYLFGLSQGSYSDLFSSHFQLTWQFGRLPFVFLFIVVGWVLAQPKSMLPLNPKFAVGLSLIGVALELAESSALWMIANRPLDQHEFLVGTAVLGVGIALLALSKPELGRFREFAKLGKYTLGVYCIHLFIINSPFSWILIARLNESIAPIVYPMVITALSFALIWFLACVPGVRKVVV